MIRVTPDPVLFELGPLRVGWYGVGYVVALAVMLYVSQRELERRGIDRKHFLDAMLFVGAFALVGARLYHVIHEWELYRNDLAAIVLPPYSGLALYGGVAGAALGILVYARWRRQPVRLALDAVIPGTLFAQGIARWGNFFNQELYGPPTELPWGIAIECANRIEQYACASYPFETTGFHPLFFYEFALNVAGGLIALYLSRRYLHRLVPGDLAAFWGIWYGLSRAYLETFREGYNWTLEGIATAQLIGIALALMGVVWLVWNHRPGHPAHAYPEAAAEPSAGDGEWDEGADEDEWDDEDDDEAGLDLPARSRPPLAGEPSAER